MQVFNKLASKDTNKRNKKAFKKDVYDIHEKKQQKLSYYFNTTSTSNNHPEDEQPPDQVQLAKLNKQLQQKAKQFDNAVQQKLIIENKISLIHMDSRTFKTKIKTALLKTLTSQAQIIRRERMRIDERLGRLVNGGKQFFHGTESFNIIQTIAKKKKQLDDLQADLKKCKNQQQKQRLKFMMAYTKKQISQKQAEWKIKQKQVDVYRRKLILAQKQCNCYYANRNWPLIQDSNNIQRYQTLQLLGKGGFGQVYKCYDIENHNYVAIKINSLDSCPKQQRKNLIKHIRRQIAIQKQLNHENIAKILQILPQKEQKRIIFAMQLYEGPELSVYIKKRGCLQQKDAKFIICQIFSALDYLSQLDPKVIHYDLKPSNIIFHKGQIKILDFGLSKQIDSEESRIQLTSQGYGTYWYLPPQTFDKNASQTKSISGKVDVWSAGVIFYEMLYGRRPFGNGQTQDKIRQEDLILKQSQILTFPTENPNRYKISQQAKKFIRQCLQVNIDTRLSAGQAFNHPYLNSKF